VSNPKNVTVIASAPQNVGTVTSPFFSVLENAVNLSIGVSATVTTGTVTVDVQWSFDGTTFFDTETPDALTTISTTKNVVKTFPIRAPFYRVRSVVATATTTVAVLANFS